MESLEFGGKFLGTKHSQRKIHRFLAAYIIYTHGRNPPKLNGYAARNPSNASNVCYISIRSKSVCL